MTDFSSTYAEAMEEYRIAVREMEANDWMGTLMELEVIVENNSDTPIYVNVTGSSINGWEVFGAGIADIGAGKK